MKSLAYVIAFIALISMSCSQTGKARPKLGLAMHSFGDASSSAIRKSMETQALDKADLAVIDGQNQQSTQDMQVDSLFEKKIGALAIDPVDAAAIGSLIAKAKVRKTPVVFFHHMPPVEAMRAWDKLFFVGTRESDAGVAQGEMVAAYWKADPAVDRNRDGYLQFIALDGDKGGTAADLLSDGFAKALHAAGMRSERLVSGNGAEGARARTAALVAKYGDRIEAFICGDNAAALGAVEAFKAAGYFKARKRVPIVGLGEGDIPPAVADAISSGTLLGAALCDWGNQGRAVFDLAYALAKGSNPANSGRRITDAKYIWIPYTKTTNGTGAASKR